MDNSKIEILASQNHIRGNGKNKMTSKNTTIARRFDNKQQFVKFFGKSVITLNELTGNEVKFFVNCLNYMNYQNTIILGSDVRNDLCYLLKLQKPAISNYIKSLKAKKILIHLDPEKLTSEEKEYFKLTDRQKKMFLVNPDVVGKGSFRDLIQMRQILIKTFDFENLTFEQEIINEASYISDDEKLKPHVIENVVHKQGDNSVETTILVKEQKENLIKQETPTNNELVQKANELIEHLSRQQEEVNKNKKSLNNFIELLQDELINNGQIEQFKELKNKTRKLFNDD